MKPAVEQAISELKLQFGDQNVSIAEMPDGGTQVIVDEIELGPPYHQATTWVGFTLTPLYPYADVYPHFVRPDLSRIDGQLHQVPIHINNSYHGRPAIMVSRRTRLAGPANPNSAVLKLLKVQAWLRDQQSASAA